ncbi:MAG: hypothetical protein ACI4F5_06365 [Acutalibacteraceae bacterium]
MKVIQDDSAKDSYGRCPIVFKGAKSLREIHDYLFKHYGGYKFAIVFDETVDEYYDYGKDIYVYFLDEILEEAAVYADCIVTDKYGKRKF